MIFCKYQINSGVISTDNLKMFVCMALLRQNLRLFCFMCLCFLFLARRGITEELLLKKYFLHNQVKEIWHYFLYRSNTELKKNKVELYTSCLYEEIS
jgi:hypothetical protein